MAQQTAVEWFHDKVDDLISDELRERVELLKNEAKQMEREQIIKAHNDGDVWSGEIYYTKTYGTRLQNETN